MIVFSQGKGVCFLLSLWSAAAAYGAVVAVPAGGNLQQAINSANPGDTIILPAGAVFMGNFTLPNKNSSSTAYITIESSMAASLAAGQRVGPSSAPLMAALVTPNSVPAIAADDSAHHYQLIGLEIRPAAGNYSYGLVTFGSGVTTSAAALPHDLVLDRVYIHGDPAAGTKRGLSLNCGAATVENSYISGIMSTWQDANAIAEWNGAGPFTITNNYVEASSENLLLGGATPAISGLVPSNITIQGNYFSKPLSWYPKSSTYAGTLWNVKNLLEIKSAKNVTITGNVLENNWQAAQAGFAVQFTVRTESGTDPTAVLENIDFEKNLVRNTAAGINLLGQDDNGEGYTSNITIRNNLFEVSSASWGGTGILYQILNAVNNLTIDHNTAIQDGDMGMMDLLPDPGAVIQNNIAFTGPYGFFGGGYGTGTPAFNYYLPGGIFRNNAIIGGTASQYPAGNFFPADPSAVGFAGYASGNYALAATSPYIAAASDGSALGADVANLQPLWNTAISGTASTGTAPAPTPGPAATPTPAAAPAAAIRVYAGRQAYTDPQGNAWSPNPGFTGQGGIWSPGPVSIANTNTPTLYQTEAYGDITYQFPVANGSHTVILKFAELEVSQAGQRTFNVYLNGQQVLQNFDVVGAAGGPHIAIDKQFPVNVTNGVVQIRLEGTRWGAYVNAIEISPASAP